MRPTLDLAVSSADRRDARRFWYDVYVEEMGRHQDDDCADHALKELSDPFEAEGNLFVVRAEGEVVGTVLSTYGSHCDLGYYADLYELRGLTRRELTVASLTNKLMVRKDYRHTTVPLRLAAATYRQGLVDGIRENYIDCNGYLLEYFRKLGFVKHRGWVEHKDYGDVYSLVFNLHNIQHLETVGSPLAPTYYEMTGTQEGARLWQ